MFFEILGISKRTSARSDISRPKSTWFSRFGALRRVYLCSTAHTVLQELCSLPQHIRNSRRTNPPGTPVDLLILPSEPRETHAVSPIIHACIAGIQRTRSQLGIGPLGMRLYARGFDEGAKWMLNSCREDIGIHTPTECLQSNPQKTPSGEFIMHSPEIHSTAVS